MFEQTNTLLWQTSVDEKHLQMRRFVLSQMFDLIKTFLWETFADEKLNRDVLSHTFEQRNTLRWQTSGDDKWDVLCRKQKALKGMFLQVISKKWQKSVFHIMYYFLSWIETLNWNKSDEKICQICWQFCLLWTLEKKQVNTCFQRNFTAADK